MIQTNLSINNKNILNILNSIDKDMPKNTEKRLLRKVLVKASQTIKPMLPNRNWKKSLRYDTWPDFKGEIYISKTKETWTATFWEKGRSRDV
jgi:hypothetical protein